MSTTQLSFGEPEAPKHRGDASSVVPVGLTYIEDAISAEVERDLLIAIDNEPWIASMSRRVQHYGWKYDYKSRRVNQDSYLGPLPTFLDSVRTDLTHRYGLNADQAIVNEYVPGQGIASHVDCEPCFGPIIAMIGLGSDVQMDFVRKADSQHWSMRFDRRGLLILTGPARYEWSHSIAKRRIDREMGIERGRRVSVTFRTVLHEIQ
jgi:alkylated DNA repair dioxygenase AlkB